MPRRFLPTALQLMGTLEDDLTFGYWEPLEALFGQVAFSDLPQLDLMLRSALRELLPDPVSLLTKLRTEAEPLPEHPALLYALARVVLP